MTTAITFDVFASEFARHEQAAALAVLAMHEANDRLHELVDTFISGCRDKGQLEAAMCMIRTSTERVFERHSGHALH